MESPPSSRAKGIPLLETKLHPPRRRHAIDRPRLRSRLDRQDRPVLTLVCAPAGFGKTTLVADWFADAPTTAWLSLDRQDNEPDLFWTYVVAAIGTAAPGAASGAEQLLTAPQPSLDAVVATLLNDLAAAGQDVVLVLDDYHVIESAEIHQSMALLLERLPPNVHVVIASRADPPLPVATLRARGQLLELRASDLRFTTDEAAAYLIGAMDLSLAPAEVAVLEGRTEGWIAALQLAALSLQGRDDTAGFVADFAGDDRFILDYLVDEVLDRQTAETRDFLLDTSILQRLSGSLCDAVTGGAGAKATLERLERANLFLVPLDDRRTWYRYHHLFADVLRVRLLDDHPDRVPELHRRASDWFEANGDRPEAITHALAGGHAEQAAKLIELAAPELHRRRQEATVRGWLEALPDEVFADRPVLTVTLVGARMATGDPTGAEPLLQSVESMLASNGPLIVFDEAELARLPALVAMYRAALALLGGDTDATIAHASRVLGLIGPGDHLRRGSATALLGLAHWATGDLGTAEGEYVEAVRSLAAANYLADALGCSLALADIQLAQGRLGDAERTFESGLRWTAEHPGLRGAADMHVGLSEVHLERNDLDGAARHLRVAAELGEHAGLPQNAYRSRVATARLHQARGDAQGALELLDEAVPLYDTDFSPPVRPVLALRARTQLVLGDLESVRGWARDRQLGLRDELTYVREYEHITLARLLLAQRDAGFTSDAVELLTRLLAAAEDGQRRASSIEILTLLATAHAEADDPAAATSALEEALRRAAPEGYVRVFLDAGPSIGALLRAVGPAEDLQRQAGRVLDASSPAPTPPAASPLLVEGLSARELDVLRLLRSDLSGPDIARELFVSLNTFRTHTKSIYTKLGVNNRREAVRRAAELGI